MNAPFDADSLPLVKYAIGQPVHRKDDPLLLSSLAIPEGLPPSLDVRHVHKAAPSAFPNGCHVAEVEVDPETGVAAVVGYSMVNDFGTVINPMLVAGQAHGGVVQGIGQAFLEAIAYDSDGQVLTGSFTDYALPRADNADFAGNRRAMSVCVLPVPRKKAAACSLRDCR